MSLRQGRQFLAIPGPTNMPDEVLGAMHRPAVDIYSGGLPAITESCLRDLKASFCTSGHTFIFAANGHGAWDAALSNVLSRGERILVLESGRFAPAWGDAAAKMGIAVEVLPGDERRAVDPAALAARLQQDLTQGTVARFKAILVVQVDTASGVVNDIAALRKAIDDSGHDALFLVDVIASLGCMPFEMDAWGVDVAVAGSQKGLMTPPGLSFHGVSEKAMAAHETADLSTHYWDWSAREGVEHYQKYCGTPPEHLLFALRQALDMLMAEGFESIHQRHALLAEATRRAVLQWGGKGDALALNIIEPGERANSVTTVLLEERHSVPLLDYCDANCNVVLGIGIGNLAGRAIRIAHMGYINAPMLLGTLGVVEMGLQALAIPHEKGGLQAAADYLAQAVPVERKMSAENVAADKPPCRKTCCC